MQLDVDQRVLYQDREVIPLPPKAMDMLIVLLDTTDYLIPDTLVAARVDAAEGTKALSCQTGPLRVERSLRDV